MKFKIFTCLLLLGLVSYACTEDEDPIDPVIECDIADITYTNAIASIFNTSCAIAGCHVVGNEANALFSLEDYESSKAASEFGRMVGAVSQDDGFTAMPIGSAKLDQCSIDEIEAWIDAGSPE